MNKHYSEKLKLRVSLNQYVTSFMQFVFCFYCMPSGELQTVAENQLILSHIKKAFLFKKIPKVLEPVVSLSHFVNDI